MKHKFLLLALVAFLHVNQSHSSSVAVHEAAPHVGRFVEGMGAHRFMPREGATAGYAKFIDQMQHSPTIISEHTKKQVMQDSAKLAHQQQVADDYWWKNAQKFEQMKQSMGGVQLHTNPMDVPSLDQALHSDVEAGLETGVKQLLDMGANPNSTNESGESLLHIAADTGRIHNVQNLLAAGANPNALDAQGKTPLHYAAQKGKVDVARALLGKGTDSSIQDAQGNTALDLAEQRGDDLIVKEILKKQEAKSSKKVAGSSGGMFRSTLVRFAPRDLKIRGGLDPKVEQPWEGIEKEFKDLGGNKAAFRKLAMKYHSDTGAHPSNMTKLNAMYRGETNPEVEQSFSRDGRSSKERSAGGQEEQEFGNDDQEYEMKGLGIVGLGGTSYTGSKWKAESDKKVNLAVLLDQAVQAGNVEGVQAALHAGASVNESTIEAARGKNNILQLLLSKPGLSQEMKEKIEDAMSTSWFSFIR